MNTRPVRPHVLAAAMLAALLLVSQMATAAQNYHAGSVDQRLKKSIPFNMSGGNSEDIARAVATAADGSMVVVGSVSPGEIGVVHLDAHGNVTLKSFISLPSPVTVEAAAVALQADGKVLIAGTRTDGGSTLLVLRLKANSNQLDPAFGTNGIAQSTVYGHGTAMVLAPDGSIWAAGYFFNSFLTYGYEFTVLHLTASGESTTGTGYYDFDRGGDNADEARAITMMPNGGVLIAGNVRTGNGINAFGLLKLNGTTGLPDPNFGNIGVDGETVFRLGQASACYDNPKAVSMGHNAFSDRIYVAGTHCQGGTGSLFALAAFNSDGTPDTAFGTQGYSLAGIGPIGAGHYDSAAAAAMHVWHSVGSPFPVLVDHIVLAGHARHVETGDTDMALVRFNNDGGVDTGFGDTGLGAGSAVVAFPDPFGGTSNDAAYGLAFDGGELNGRDLIVAGYAFSGTNGANDYDFAVTRVLNGDRIFWDGFGP